MKPRATDRCDFPHVYSLIFLSIFLRVSSTSSILPYFALFCSISFAQSHHVQLTNARRWLHWLKEDRKQRKKHDYLTARDVHRYIIKPETDHLQCRYCELPGLAEQKDPETDRFCFGAADLVTSSATTGA